MRGDWIDGESNAVLKFDKVAARWTSAGFLNKAVSYYAADVVPDIRYYCPVINVPLVSNSTVFWG